MQPKGILDTETNLKGKRNRCQVQLASSSLTTRTALDASWA